MAISVNLGKTTSRPRRVNIKTPDVQTSTILATPAVEASVAVETRASMMRHGGILKKTPQATQPQRRRPVTVLLFLPGRTRFLAPLKRQDAFVKQA
jgi:hypothetical protein